ncbi:MAG: TldD/PmbA family protein [Dehalococcoidia bacterium]
MVIPNPLIKDATGELLEEATKRFGQAEIYRVESQGRPVTFEANRLKEINRRDQSGVAMRVISSGRIGFTSTTNPDDEKLLVDRAAALAELGTEATFEFPEPSEYPEVDIHDPQVEALTETEMIETGRDLIERVRDQWPDLLCDARVGKSAGRMYLANSAGVAESYRQTNYYVFLGGELIRGTDMLSVWAGHSSSGFFGAATTDEILKDVLEQLENSRELAPPPTGDVPVIFTPRGVAATLLDPLMSGFNGKNIASGASPIIEKEGKQELDTRISIWDDPTLSMASGSRPCDDEGVASRRVTLVDKGVIGEPLFDLQTAGKTGRQTTASAHRGLSSAPSPSASVLDVAPGDAPYADLFSGIQKGLVVEQLLGAGQGNELGGDFNANVLLGYLVENGRIVGRVKDTMISGNVYEVLANVEAVSSEAEWVFGSVRTPGMRCRGINVAAKG